MPGHRSARRATRHDRWLLLAASTRTWEACGMIRDEVFISYSRKDAAWLEKVQTMLVPLEHAGLCKVWTDAEIKPGQEWKKEVEKALARAKVAVLLVSPDFLASDFIVKHELSPLLEAAAKEGVTVIWIPIRACSYKRSAIVKYQAACDPKTPLAKLPEAEQEIVLAGIVDVVADVLEFLLPPAAPVPAPPSSSEDQCPERSEAPKATPVAGRSTVQKIADLVAPLMGTERERRALLGLALGSDCAVLDRLDFSGPVEPFVLNLIDALLAHGEVKPGKPALRALLEVVRERLGVDRQARIDALYLAIDALNRDRNQSPAHRLQQPEHRLPEPPLTAAGEPLAPRVEPTTPQQVASTTPARVNRMRPLLVGLVSVVLVVAVLVWVLSSTAPPDGTASRQTSSSAGSPAPTATPAVAPVPTSAPVSAPAPVTAVVAPPVSASAPPVKNIHGWSTQQVQDLQQQTAQALRTKAEFQDKLKDGNKTKVEFRDKLKDGGDGPLMVVIPAGSFQMGSPADEKGRDDDERQHEVEVSPAFAIGKYEVTVAEFRRFVEVKKGYQTEAEKSGGCYSWTGSEWKKDPSKNWRNPGFKQEDDHPVVCVSWNDATAYVEWLSEQTGQKYRLPTEAEWEYAARAGTKTARFWGDDLNQGCQYANVADLTAKNKFSGWTVANCEDGYVYTAPLGQFQPNAFGLHDMLGNVWEWCSDWFGDYPTGTVRDPTGATTGGARVCRGGSWDDDARDVRAAIRYAYDPGDRLDYLGFRPARVQE